MILKKLEDAGIAVESGLLESAAAELNPGFIKRMEAGRPFVRVKLAMSLDGRTAMASGESQWISSEASRNDVQRLRAESSAISFAILNQGLKFKISFYLFLFKLSVHFTRIRDGVSRSMH